jgi:hypothetical protein
MILEATNIFSFFKKNEMLNKIDDWYDRFIISWSDTKKYSICNNSIPGRLSIQDSV